MAVDGFLATDERVFRLLDGGTLSGAWRSDARLLALSALPSGVLVSRQLPSGGDVLVLGSDLVPRTCFVAEAGEFVLAAGWWPDVGRIVVSLWSEVPDSSGTSRLITLDSTCGDVRVFVEAVGVQIPSVVAVGPLIAVERQAINSETVVQLLASSGVVVRSIAGGTELTPSVDGRGVWARVGGQVELVDSTATTIESFGVPGERPGFGSSSLSDSALGLIGRSGNTTSVLSVRVQGQWKPLPPCPLPCQAVAGSSNGAWALMGGVVYPLGDAAIGNPLLEGSTADRVQGGYLLGATVAVRRAGPLFRSSPAGNWSLMPSSNDWIHRVPLDDEAMIGLIEEEMPRRVSLVIRTPKSAVTVGSVYQSNYFHFEPHPHLSRSIAISDCNDAASRTMAILAQFNGSGRLFLGDVGRWESRETPADLPTFAEVFLDPENPHHVVLWHPQAVYQSQDSGAHWTRVSAPQPLASPPFSFIAGRDIAWVSELGRFFPLARGRALVESGNEVVLIGPRGEVEVFATGFLLDVVGKTALVQEGDGVKTRLIPD